MNLETLELAEQELQAAKEMVRQMAYYKWETAGCQPGDSLAFWREAEREWIEYYYVPDRQLVGAAD